MPNGKGYTITFDGVSSTTIPEFMCHTVSRSLLGSNRSQIRETAGREGAWYFPEKRGLRVIKIQASVLTTLVGGSFPANRRDAVTRVADWLDKPGFKKLKISDETGRFYKAALTTEVDVDEWRHKGTFELEFIAEPYAYDDNIATESFSLNKTGTPHTWTMAGSLDTFPVVELTAVGGNLTSVVFTTNGYIMVLSQTLLSGATITINSINFTTALGTNTDTELDGSFDAGTIAMIGVGGQFPILLGAPPFGIQGMSTVATGSATSIGMVVRWRRRYR